MLRGPWPIPAPSWQVEGLFCGGGLSLLFLRDALNQPCLSFLSWGAGWDTPILLPVLAWVLDHLCS